MSTYGERWLKHLEADPKGGTVASAYRSTLHALKQTPFLAAIVTRDEGTFGTYLRKPENLFKDLPAESLTRGFLQMMQEAGAVRQDVDIEAVASILDTLSSRLLEPHSPTRGEPTPPFEKVMQTLAEMVDRMLTPEEGGNLQTGKAVLRQLAASTRSAFSKKEAERNHVDESSQSSDGTPLSVSCRPDL